MDGAGEGSSLDPGATHANNCCCNRGGACSCVVKKEPLYPVPEGDCNIRPPATITPRKPRLTNTQSEASLTIFTNGHHKPVHRHNDTAHTSGAPYKIPIPHSVPGNGSFSKRMARRSTDSLPLPETIQQAPMQLQESISSAQQEVRLVRSEETSPSSGVLHSYDGYEPPIPPLDLAYAEYHHSSSSPVPDDYSYQHTRYESYFSPRDEIPPVLSAGLISPIEKWTAGDLPLEGGAFSNGYSEFTSYSNNSYDHNNMGRTGLATSSSGGYSEGGDYVSHFPLNHNPTTANATDMSEASPHRYSNATSFMATQPISILSEQNLQNNNNQAYMHATTASPTELEERNHRVSLGSETFVRHGITVQAAQIYAHSGATNNHNNIDSTPAPADSTPLDTKSEVLWAQIDDPIDDQEVASTPAWANR